LCPRAAIKGLGAPVLWSVARRDKRLRAAGLAQYDVATGMGPRPGVNDFFGGHYFWGAASTAAKAAAIDAAIAVQPVARRRIVEKV